MSAIENERNPAYAMLEARAQRAGANANAGHRRNVNLIRHEDVSPDPSQPRKEFSISALEHLAGTMRRQGILQPLLLRPDPADSERYLIISGERRWRAAQLAELEWLPAVVKTDLDGLDISEVQLIENLERQNLSEFEETQAALKLLAARLAVSERETKVLLSKRFKGSSLGAEADGIVDDVLTLLGLTLKSFYAQRLPLLDLDQALVAAINSGRLAYSTARLLGRISDPEIRLALLNEVLEQGLSRQEVEKRLKLLQDKPTTGSNNDLNRLAALKKRWSSLEGERLERAQTLLSELEGLLAE
jgi:ParB family transcriptional regulator, chromosome partitioning protein